MKRLSFLVNRGENDCFMVHGLEWATYAEGDNWSELTKAIMKTVDQMFPGDERPAFLDFRFPDGTVVSLCA